MRERKKIILYPLLFLSLLTYNILYSQESNRNFYRHYNGTIGDNMIVVADIISIRNEVSGYYFHYLRDPKTKKVFQYSRTIGISGKVSENTITFHELNNPEIEYSGTFDSEGNISGVLLKNNGKKRKEFTLIQDYSEGSFPLLCYTLSDSYFLMEGLTGRSAPHAKIEIAVLYPDIMHGNVDDSIKMIISKHLSSSEEVIRSPQRFIENLKTGFFSSYKKSMDGISDFNISSFIWEKSILMKVLYNKNGIMSLRYEKSVNTGGAHFISMTEFSIIDLKNGNQLILENFLKPGYEKKLKALVNEKLRKINDVPDNQLLTAAGFFVDTINLSNDFYLNNDGLGFFYNVYEIAPFSAGTFDIFIPFGKFKEFIKPGVLKWVNLN